MRIKRFSYENKATGWKLDPVEFGDFNLLVGVSGVGKTKILQAIEDVHSITHDNGSPKDGCVWDIEFVIDDVTYFWHYCMSRPSALLADKNNPRRLPQIENEELRSTGLEKDFTFTRKLAMITIDGKTLPIEHNSSSSLLQLFSSDNRIKNVIEELNKINSLSFPQAMTPEEFELYKEGEIMDGFNTLEAVQVSDYSVHTKLIIACSSLPDVFEEIKEVYMEIFPQFKDIKIQPIYQHESEHFGQKPKPSRTFMTFEFSLQETGVDVQIRQQDISTGMMKTLLLIGEIYLSSPGTVILIDEFENSLGVNCIDIFDKIPYQKRGLQFIITSHHPQIISSIPMQYWKIVTRHGSTVTVHDAKEFKRLNASKLDPFVQLINLPEYTEGVTSE